MGEVSENGKSHNITNLLDQDEADKHFLVKFRPSVSSPDLPNGDDSKLAFDWIVEMIDTQSFYIMMKFSRPDLMSRTNSDRDGVLVTVKNVGQFYSQNGKTATTPLESNFFNIRPQRNYPYVDSDIIGDTKAYLEGSLKSFLAGNLFVSVVGAVTLQHMWGMINALQIMVLAILFNVVMP